MRGQISIEYIILIGVILVVTIPFFYYGLSKSGENIRYQQGSDAVNSIVKAADEVYSLGLGSRDFVWVNIPIGVTGVSADDKNLIMNVSIFGGTSEFVALAKANLTVTQDFLGKIVKSGTHKVAVETYLNITTNSVMVLIGGFCGDEICSGVENSGTCNTDCKDVCGDGVCNYPDTESCLGTGKCQDCIGSQADCDSGKTCQQDTNTGNLVCVAGGTCPDGICAYPYTENCNNCEEDCLPSGWTCCEDPILNTWFPDNTEPFCDIPPSVTDCGDFCKWLGFTDPLRSYRDGVCRQSPPKCVNEGEVHESGGDGYCPAGAQANTCCCIPS